ncbi:hypothetical protein SAMN06272775_7162 [Streptomyces sp. 2323.1]|nr:hypothetical protein SAMN06272775_0110 [Streptomyces sp. 2323.1]SOE16248.1 hypothetical protein SAMN06272775_7162 [Streptomyces sp. 2323.1]
MADETATIYEQLRDLAGEIESLADAVGAPRERSITQRRMCSGRSDRDGHQPRAVRVDKGGSADSGLPPEAVSSTAAWGGTSNSGI